MTLFDDVIGQERAVAQLRAAAAAPVHAYLFVGPPGVGRSAAARSFAAALVCRQGGCGTCEDCRLARAAMHPNVVVYERQGARMSVDDARELARLASLSPAGGGRQVIVIPEFDLAAPIAAALLKTLEEPAPSTVFVGLAEGVTPAFETIASRCVRIDFGPVPDEVLRAALEAEGADPDVARAVVQAAAGRADRARLLLSDPAFAARRDLWTSVPARLDGTGRTVAALADELLASLDSLATPVEARQSAELAELEAAAARYGSRVRRREVQERHKRELRRARTDELRAGLSALAGVYRDRLAAGGHDAAAAVRALRVIADTTEALVRNPNEVLLLQALLLRLPA